jgi:indolepyruvate ferredoxin oxidoreductase beta subunit
MKTPLNIIITGIGGQGVVTLASCLRRALIGCGYRIAGLDNRGGAQRLGHVAAVIRASSDEEYPLGPEIPPGSCHLLITMEISEGLRYASALGRETIVIAGSRLVIPTNQRRRREAYVTKEECRTAYRARVGSFCELDAEAQALERWGDSRAANMILLGRGVRELGNVRLRHFLMVTLTTLAPSALAAFESGCG